MSGQKTQQRIILWSVPRSLSSAFYRAIMNGPNTKVFRILYLFIWDLMSFSILYWLYHDGQLCGEKKPAHTFGQGSAL